MGQPIILNRGRQVVHACVGGFDFALMVSQLLGVSLRTTRDTTKVMLGVSLRARFDTTLENIMLLTLPFSNGQDTGNPCKIRQVKTETAH